MKRLFIINAKAGGGRALQSWRSHRERFAAEFESGSAVEWIPSSPEEFLARVSEFRSFGEWVIWGGDGTLNASINGLLRARDSGTAADVQIPVVRVAGAGSGSDYFRSLPIGDPVPVDAVRVTIDGAERRYFLNMASVGLSARVAAAKGRLPSWMPRSLCYALPTVSEVWGARPFEAELRVPGAEAWSGAAWGVFLSKGRYAGEGMRFASEVRLDDGLLEVSWVEDQSPLSILFKLPTLYGAGLRSEPGVRKLRASEVELSFREPQPLEFDGEPTRATRLRFEVLSVVKIGLKVGRFSMTLEPGAN